MNSYRIALLLGLSQIVVPSVLAADGFILQRIEGELAQGADGGLFSGFSESVLNDSTEFGYRARLRVGSGFNLLNNDGAWLDDGCDARLLARENDAVPGTGVEFGDSIDPSSFQLNDAGVAAFRSSVMGAGVTSANEDGIFRCLPGGSTTLIAREGDLEPITGATIELVGRPALTGAADGTLFYKTEFVRDGGTAVASNDSAIFGNVGGVQTLIVRESTPTPVLKLGGTGTFGQILSEAFVSDSGHLVFLANIIGVGRSNIGVFQRDPGGTLTCIYQKSEPAPDAAGAPTAELLNSFRQIGVNDSGEIIIRANLLRGTAGVTAANDQILLTDAGGTLRRIAREGDVDPGGLPYFSFGTLFIGNSGATAYAALALDGTSRRTGIYGTPSAAGAPALIARESDPAPGSPSTFLRIDRPAVSHDGRVAFTGRLAIGGGVTSINDAVLYFTDAAATPPAAPLAQEGDIEDDIEEVMLAFDLNQPNEPNGGVASSGRALNDVGNMIVNITTGVPSASREGVYIFGDRAPEFCDLSPDVAFNIPPGSGPVPVFWTPPTVVDDLDPTPTVVSSHMPGDMFGPGVTIVSYTATDAAGNVSTARFRVIITEIRDPGALVMLDRVVNRGDPAGGTANDFRSFTEVAVNSNSDVAFSASIITGAQGIWSNGHGAPGGVPGLVALQGDPADTAEYQSFRRLAFNDTGNLAFQSVLQGAGVTSANNGAVDVEVGMALGDIVRQGNTATDSSGAATARVFQQFYRPANSDTVDGDAFVRAALQIGTGGVAPTTDTGIWQIASSGTSLLERVREGDLLPDASGRTFGQINARVVAGENGGYVFSSGLKGSGVRSTTDSGVFYGMGSTITPLVIEGDNAPCNRDGEGASRPVKGERAEVGRFATFFAESVDETGSFVAIRAAMRREGTIDFDNDSGIWLIDVAGGPDPVSPVVNEAHQAPGFAEGVAFDRFDDVVVTPAGDVWFTAYLRHDSDLGIGSSNDFGVWTTSDGYLRWFVHEGLVAPNTDSGTIRRITDFAYNDGAAASTVVLEVGTGDTTATNETCLLSAFDMLTGLFEINLREGDTFEFAPGDERLVTNFTIRDITNASGGSGGYGSPVVGGGVDLIGIQVNFNGNGGAVALRPVGDSGILPSAVISSGSKNK